MPGRRPAIESDQLHLGDVGEQAVGLAQQLVDAAGGDGGVEALLLGGGADDQAAVGARHQVDALGGDDPLAGSGAVAAAQLEDLALDRAHRRAGVLGQPLGPARPRRRWRGRRPAARSSSPSAVRTPTRRSPSKSPATTSVPVRTSTPAAASAASSAAVSARGSTAASPGAWTPPLKDGRQARLELAAAARRQPLGLEPERALQVVDAAQLRRLVAVEGDVEGALLRRSRCSPRSPPPARRRTPGRAGPRPGSSPAAPARRRPARRPAPASRRRRGWRRPAARRGSSTATRAPRWAARQAQLRPIAPPPTNIASKLRFSVKPLPPPALPGSGSDGRWPRCHPLSPRGLPLLLRCYPARAVSRPSEAVPRFIIGA